jgi:hypothetical protein
MQNDKDLLESYKIFFENKNVPYDEIGFYEEKTSIWDKYQNEDILKKEMVITKQHAKGLKF